ncbi:beta-glucosidase [Jatrophihabitans sp. YIM 134969]
MTGTPWRDPAVPAAERVEDLLARLTLREKVAQLYGVWVGVDRTSGDVAPHQHELTALPEPWEDLLAHGIGQLTRPLGTAPVEPTTGAAGIAATQRAVVAAGRHGIPALVHEECLTGLAAWQASVYPSPLCWGASFDPPLVEAMAHQIGTTMRRLGVHQGLAPVLDVARDLRWGRVEETIGEDPLLVGTIGSAYVRGLQSAGVVATLKHFVGYSASRAGRNLAPVSIGPRELADVLLPPFEMALRAGADSVMNSYSDLDGVPVAADAAVLDGLLRERLGFEGTVVADYFAVTFLQLQHGVSGGPGESAALALRAGIDVELPTVSAYGEPLVAAVAAGDVTEDLVDRAVRRVLRQKLRLGLLDPDWQPDAGDGVDDFVLDRPEHRALARRLARRSTVLLANDGILPLADGASLAVVGPRSDEPGAMMGCYSFPLHVGVHHPDVPLGLEVPTLLDALRADATAPVTWAVGCPVTGGDDAGLQEAADVAAAADVCVVVLGDQAGLFGRGTSGEGCDAVDLRLPGRQGDLLEAVLVTGTPVVLVLLVGRPYDLTPFLDRLAAVVCGFYPGEEGGPALAEVLRGSAPEGRLPVSFPAGPGGQPGSYLAPRLGSRTEVSSVDPTPVFPFGHGLTYHPATWEQVQHDDGPWATDGTHRVSVTLAAPTDHPTSEVVQVYLEDPVAQVARPLRALVAAARVDLRAGERCTVHIDLPADLVSYTGADGRRRVDAGAVVLHVGASSRDIRGRLDITMAGAVRHPGPDREFHAAVQLEMP